MKSSKKNNVLVKTNPGSELRRLQKLACEFLEEMDLKNCELSLSLVTDLKIQKLNWNYRHKNKATDVLSFPVAQVPFKIVGRRNLGDIVISRQTATRVSRELGTSRKHELNLYLAHGLLHLLGYDHLTKRDSEKMANAEEQLLKNAGMLSR